MAFKAEVLLGLDRISDAADAAGDAFGETGVDPQLLDALAERLRGDHFGDEDSVLAIWIYARRLARIDRPLAVSLDRAHRVLGDAQRALAPSQKEACAQSDQPLVRALARGQTGAPLYEDEPVPTRLFSAHGPDFKSGTFVAFETSCEDRLTYFDAELFHALDELFETDDLEVAFGRGYGLAIERGLPTGDLQGRIDQINAARVLPFPLVLHFHQPFDVLEPREHDPDGTEGENARLARRFAQDLASHPARMANPQDTAPYAKILGSFRKQNPAPDVLAALFEEAAERYGPVGLTALELFAARAGQENENLALRKQRAMGRERK